MDYAKTYREQNEYLYTKNRNISRMNTGALLTPTTIKKYNISIEDVKDIKKLHPDIETDLLKSIKKEEVLTAKKLEKQKEIIKQQPKKKLVLKTKTIIYNIDIIKELLKNQIENEGTFKKYVSKIKALMSHFELENIEELNMKDLEQYINQLKDEDARATLAGILKILRTNPEIKLNLYEIELLNNKISKKSQENQEIKEVISDYTFEDLQSINRFYNYYEKYSINHILSDIYINTPYTFRTLQNVLIIDDDKLNDNISDFYNKSEGVLIVNDTKGGEFKSKIKLPIKIVENINKSLEKYPRDYLFSCNKRNPSQFTKFFSDVLGLTITQYRKARETYNYYNVFKGNVKNFMNNAKYAFHDGTTAINYYVDMDIKRKHKQNPTLIKLIGKYK